MVNTFQYQLNQGRLVPKMQGKESKEFLLSHDEEDRDYSIGYESPRTLLMEHLTTRLSYAAFCLLALSALLNFWFGYVVIMRRHDLIEQRNSFSTLHIS